MDDEDGASAYRLRWASVLGAASEALPELDRALLSREPATLQNDEDSRARGCSAGGRGLVPQSPVPHQERGTGRRTHRRGRLHVAAHVTPRKSGPASMRSSAGLVSASVSAPASASGT